MGSVYGIGSARGGRMTTGAIVLAAVAAVVMMVFIKARAAADTLLRVHHPDWAQITSKHNLRPVEQNNIGIGLMLYKLDDFINNHTSDDCNASSEPMLNTDTYRRNKEKSCCEEVEMMKATLQLPNKSLLEININGTSLLDSAPDKTIFAPRTNLLKTDI